MKTAAVATGLALAGLAGGVLGVFAGGGRVAAPPPGPAGGSRGTDAPIPATSDAAALARLEERVTALEASLAAAGTEAAALRRAVEERTREQAILEERLADARGPGPATDAGDGDGEGAESAMGGRIETDLARRTEDLARSVERIQSLRALAGLTTEQRWEKARQEVGLTPHQEQTLKEAIDTYRRDMRAALVDREVTSRDDDVKVRLRMPDPEKAKEARRTYDDRVAGLLNDDQSAKWKDGGFASSLGAPTGTTSVTADVIQGE